MHHKNLTTFLYAAKPKALPTVNVKLPKDGIVNIKEGEAFELNFEVSDDSEAIFYKGDNRIDDMGRAVVTRMGRTFRFYIPEVKESDSGQYIMEVQGESGITNKSFKIKVQGMLYGLTFQMKNIFSLDKDFWTVFISLHFNVFALVKPNITLLKRFFVVKVFFSSAHAIKKKSLRALHAAQINWTAVIKIIQQND